MCVYIIVLIFCSYFVPLQAMHGREPIVFSLYRIVRMSCANMDLSARRVSPLHKCSGEHGLFRDLWPSPLQMC